MYIEGRYFTIRNYSVYEHIFPNGKRYIGITNKDIPEKRWGKNGNGYTEEHQPVMYNAIQKYGWDNITHNILYRNLSKEEACALEKRLISKYNTNCHRGNEGYNMIDGGEGNPGHKLSDDAKEKIRNAHVGRTGKKCPNSKAVVCDGIEYSSRGEFAEAFGLNPTTVGTWLNGVRGMPVKWYELGLRYKYDDGVNIKPQQKKHRRKVIYDGMVFNSQKELSDYLGITPSCLCLWLKNPDNQPLYFKEKIYKI